MKTQLKLSIVAVPLLLTILLPGSNVLAAVSPIGPFPASNLITFAGLADSTEVNGLTVSGVLFSYTVGGNPLNGAVIINGGPGSTNNITPPNIVSIGNNTGTLTMFLPFSASMLGYGYAILNTGAVTNATTISVFSGASFLGSLSYNGVPDPVFTGGFAGIQSTSPFDRVAVSFNSVAPAFALDNIRISAIPEPSTWLLLGSGLAGLACWRRYANA